MLQTIIGVLCGIGLYWVLMDLNKIPYFKTSRAVENISKRQKAKTSLLEVWLGSFSAWLSKRIRLNEFKRQQWEADLKTAQMDITPEKFIANAITKAAIVGIFAIPMLFIFPLLCPVVIFLAIFLYNNEVKSISRRIRAKREKIEYELPHFVATIEKTLKHSRDVQYMLDSYRETAGPELKHELDITVADMKSGNIESALTRLESRVGSGMMSNVCQGLIGITKGDDTEMYWAALSITLADEQRQRLRLEARKVPRKVNRLSMCLLVCFMLTYVVVILDQIMSSLGVLFG